jgi:hypothetical protein
MCTGDVAINVWSLGDTAFLMLPHAASISTFVARARLQTVQALISCAMAEIDCSSGEAFANPLQYVAPSVQAECDLQLFV